MEKPLAKASYLGHRERLRKRFIVDGGNNMRDDELLELLLFYSLPRTDTKNLARSLIKESGSMSRLINSQLDSLTSFDGVGDTTAILISLIKVISKRANYSNMVLKNTLSSWDSLIEFCLEHLFSHERELLNLISLDSKKRIIAIDEIFKGSLSHAVVMPRELVKKAISLGAASIILVHNHPSGIARPSDSDIKLTFNLIKACDGIVELFDHIILGLNGKYYSFRADGLIR